MLLYLAGFFVIFLQGLVLLISQCLFVILVPQDLLEDSGWLVSQLEVADTLMDGVEADGGNADDLRAERQKLADRHQALQGELAELVGDMETGAQIVEQFQVSSVVSCHHCNLTEDSCQPCMTRN